MARSVFVGDDLAAQAVRQRLGHPDFSERVDQARVAGEIDDAVIVRAPGQLVRVFLRRALDQYALHGADHCAVYFGSQFLDARLQAHQAANLDVFRHIVVQFGRRGARTLAVDEAEAGVETDLVDQLHGFFEVFLGFAWGSRR